MNAATSLFYLHHHHKPTRHPLPSPPPHPALTISSSLFRPHRRRPHRRPPYPHRPTTTTSPSPPPDHTIEFAVSIDDIAARASRLEARIRRFLSSGADAYHDLRTSVHIDGGGHRVFFSCRRSSLLFYGNLLVWSLAGIVAVRVLAWLRNYLWLGSGHRSVVRRDRSLAGREVVVERRFNRREAENRSLRAPVNPLSPPRGAETEIREAAASGKQKAKFEALPKWWPESVSSPVAPIGKQEDQIEANRLVRAILDRRMSGKDFKGDDIIQLRRICKNSGARVSFETTNARDSFYRAAVDLVLDSCSKLMQPTATVLVDGEEARRFICGLSCNIGLENVRAARLVCAAVAARTRASFLQSWALEVQGRRSEALEELSKICRIYLVFPPEEYSPEMEMVAGGLKKNLGVEQREHLLNMFKGICGAENQRIAGEALGLLDLV